MPMLIGSNSLLRIIAFTEAINFIPFFLSASYSSYYTVELSGCFVSFVWLKLGYYHNQFNFPSLITYLP